MGVSLRPSDSALQILLSDYLALAGRKNQSAAPPESVYLARKSPCRTAAATAPGPT